MTASPPEYNFALNMRQNVQTISSNDLDRNAVERPPSYGTATSGAFKLVLPGIDTPLPDTLNSQRETMGGERNDGYISEEEERGPAVYFNEAHNVTYLPNESSELLSSPPSYEDISAELGSSHFDGKATDQQGIA